ncbi:MAG: chorismate synthase [Spirochaetae bacterium HGW-Spirochaetae-1]|jgi:chorismate synthase|nr:MAG: chorismate synthase [Spirochaetae bacterium HGW-Spirochaetae-1]
MNKILCSGECMKIVITGPKGSGKTTIGKRLAELLNIPFFETDGILEQIWAEEKGETLTFREIYQCVGENEFRHLEKRAVEKVAGLDWCIISTGGGSLYDAGSRALLSNNSIMVLLKAGDDLLWERITRDGIPVFLSGDGGFEILKERNIRLYETVEHISDIVIDIEKDTEKEIHCNLAELIFSTMVMGMSSPNTFGEIVRVTTFGESHGAAVGAVLDGVAPGIDLSEDDIQAELNRRRPGQSRVSTPRDEKDRVHILSGIFEGKTTGTPICMLVYNEDQDSSKYDALRHVFRPGHADFSFWKKYGLRDHRGGGRSSGRETIGRVAAGAVARKMLGNEGIEICAYAEMIAGITGERVDYSFIEKNSVRAADPDKAAEMEEAIMAARKNRDSVGGIVRCIIKNCPAGLGDPVFGKLDARLSMAFFSIGAVKGVEIGAGFSAASMKGSENNDPMREGNFESNNAGGILGGISTGQDIVVRIAVKPTPSIAREQHTCDTADQDTVIAIEGRHDPCIVPRIIPVIESMAALVMLDSLRMQRCLRGVHD